MTKAELLNNLTAKSLRLVSIVEEADTVKNAAGIKQYIANVMEQNGESVYGRNIGFYVFNEGEATETAFLRDQPVAKSQVRSAALTYLNGLVPTTYIRVELGGVNEEQRSATASAYKDNGNGTCSMVNLLVYKDGVAPITHREIA